LFLTETIMASPLEKWAIPHLQQLLPLDDASLTQVISYADSLPKDEAAEHLKNLLGDHARSLEFISAFNLRRPNAASASASAPSSSRTTTPIQSHATRPSSKKKKQNIHALPARQLQGQGNVRGAYLKRSEDDYMPAAARQSHKDQIADNLALQRPHATQMPLITDDDVTTTNRPITSKPPPSASGPLISDALSVKKAASSRNASPAPKPTKVNISGGTAMHGASTALSDLDAAIRTLELQTNPTLSATSPADHDNRRCNCMATRHPLLEIAPNCLQCGKIICIKEGMGPCTFCHSPLLPPDELHKVLRVLKDERGEEKMKADKAAHKRPDVALGKARAFTGRDFLAQPSPSRPSPLSSTTTTTTPAGSDDEAGEKAKAHRDRLLGFQAHNARRTRIHDEAADFDVPSAGTNMWASPQERARQLKQQQRMLREMEWHARPDYEKRHVVASIDVQRGKVVRRMAEVEKPAFEVDDDDDGHDGHDDYRSPAPERGGAFSYNPLASGLIRPRAREPAAAAAAAAAGGKDVFREKRSVWRRVQMDEDDNERWILDGGVYGDGVVDRPLGAEEHAVG
jgi:hypothetical protein